MKNEDRYITIPDQVAKDKRLKPIAKLLYGEIKELQKIDDLGYCTASNRYFAEHFNVSERCIVDNLNDLERYGYVNRRTACRTNRSLFVK